MGAAGGVSVVQLAKSYGAISNTHNTRKGIRLNGVLGISHLQRFANFSQYATV